ncbi:MAG: SDR family oxidoreductase [Christensenellaceae bacterium]|jgi:NAD(P)-dependent dehydrogenase (short-subunit alcohol dehydrogenase family)|nr:SDR family oxidoreductase [Christensenellaceae bacterium]
MELPFELDLKGQVAVVSGAGGVLCSMFARALAACGASVALLDINEAAAKAAADAITAEGGKALAVKADCLSKESLLAAREAVLKAFGPCSILLNGAGGNSPRGTTDDEQFSPEIEGIKTFFELDPDGVRFVFDLNVVAALLTTQVFARDMAGKGQKGGNIINISSMNAFRPLTKIPAYSGAKAAVSNFTQWLAVYFAKAGIRVNALAPGFFVSNQNRALLFNEDGSPTARTGKILAATPMGRFGEAEELIGTLLFLLNGKAASFITGVVIPVDGGFSAYSGV